MLHALTLTDFFFLIKPDTPVVVKTTVATNTDFTDTDFCLFLVVQYC